MSKAISVIVPHQLGAYEAKRRINNGIPEFGPTFRRAAKIKQISWLGDVLGFEISVLGIRVAGTVALMDDNATVKANLPLLLAPFAKNAERLIQKYGAELLAGSAPDQGWNRR